jgi:plasmid stabilization system protein ParE
MVYKVRWTPESEESFDAIIEYLENHWSDREIIRFVTKTNETIDQIVIHPEMFKSSSKKNIRAGIIIPQINLFYRISENDKTIILLSFWDNRQDPRKRKY